MNAILNAVDIIGRKPARSARFLFDIIGLISIALRSSSNLFNGKRRRIFVNLFRRQLYNTGVRAFYVNGMIAVLVGCLLMANLFSYLPQRSLLDQYGYFFVVVVVRELGPLISGLILIARSATAVTSEIGYLRMTREFQVLHGMGIDPVFLFLLPIFFAFPVSLFVMFVYFNLICLVSAFIVIWMNDPGVSFLAFVYSIMSQISLNEVAINFVKAILGGTVIGAISIYYGARLMNKFDDISEAVSDATTSQLTIYFLINVALSLLAYTQ